MSLLKNRKFQIGLILSLFILLMVIIAFLVLRDEATVPTASSKGNFPQSFTFFGIGSGTQLTRAVRNNLADKLGSAAIERKGTIDLTTGPFGLLSMHFKTLNALHQDLNSATGARVEHNITRLTYRYPKDRNSPFKYVRIVFSNDNAAPLYFRIIMKKEGAAVVDTLREKYGPPKVLPEKMDGVAVLYWEKNNDRLIVSQRKDRFGDPEYLVMFYFVNNLEQLIRTEKTELDQKEQELKKAGKSAF